MGLMDKVKAAAEKAAAEAKKGTAQVKGKLEDAQLRRKADDAAKRLGYLIFKERAQGESAGEDADRLVEEIGDVWYVVSSTGTPVESEGEAEGSGETDEGGQSTLAVEESDLGQILVDSRGRTLYAFMPDEQGASTCYDDCAATWPALTVEGDPAGGDGVDAALLGTAERDDGSVQVTYDGWPLYLFAGDETRDDVNGQGVGDVWYVVAPDGTPIQ